MLIFLFVSFFLLLSFLNGTSTHAHVKGQYQNDRNADCANCRNRIFSNLINAILYEVVAASKRIHFHFPHFIDTQKYLQRSFRRRNAFGGDIFIKARHEPFHRLEIVFADCVVAVHFAVTKAKEVNNYCLNRTSY